MDEELKWLVRHRWEVMYGESQRIERLTREGAIKYRKDGGLDMRYTSSRFIANPHAGVTPWPAMDKP